MITIAYYLGPILVVVGVIITRRLPQHVDRERLGRLDDPSRAFSALGPSHEVLSERGRRLLSISFAFYAAGAFIPLVAAIIKANLHP